MMNGFLYVLFVLSAMGILGCAWMIARSFDFAVSGTIAKIKNEKEGTPGVAGEKNRCRIAAGRNQSDHFCGVSEESTITPVVADEDELPISKSTN